MRWIKDEDFIRGNIPMTKFEVRMAAIGLLEIEKGDVFLDIGAGTGSISIEGALQGAEVYSIEMEDEGLELIERNAQKFGALVNTIKDKAPDGIDKVPLFNKCFIGGSKGNIASIFRSVDERLPQHGIVVANFVTLKNLYDFGNLLKEEGYGEIDIRMIQVSLADARTNILKAQNPVFITRGKKL